EGPDAGTELDLRIHKQVLGFRRMTERDANRHAAECKDPGPWSGWQRQSYDGALDVCWGGVPRYSSDLGAARQMAGKGRDLQPGRRIIPDLAAAISAELDPSLPAQVTFVDVVGMHRIERSYMGEGDTWALAASRAAAATLE